MIKVIANSPQISASVTSVSNQILERHPDDRPLFVALLRGAAPFASQLMFAITTQKPEFHPELDYMMVSTYGSGREAGTPRIVTDLAPDTEVQDRTVIVLDDVLDKGVTAHFVIKHLKNRGAKSVELAVLVDKQTDRTYPITADYACFTVEDLWLSGMGMDDANLAPEGDRWRQEIIAHTSEA